MNQKRYQIFLSSTYSDLELERRTVMQSLLEIDCIPSGMEFFPASDEETFNFIKSVIDQSDYYILILAGRYGSLAADGISYTEKEYDYAREIGKPVLSFVREDIENVAVKHTDNDEAKKRKLEKFRRKVLQSGKLSKKWRGPDELAGKVVTTLTSAIRRYPAVGWVRSDTINASHEIALNESKDRIQQLEQALAQCEGKRNGQQLASGDEEFSVHFFIETQVRKVSKGGAKRWATGDANWVDYKMSWNEIISTIGHKLLLQSGNTERAVCGALNRSNEIEFREAFDDEEHRISSIKISSDILVQIRTQLTALNIIEPEYVDHDIIWHLTEFGKGEVFRLISIKSENSD